MSSYSVQSGVKLVIFDLDGTLLDTIKDLGQAVNYALSLRSLDPYDDAQYRMMVGHGVRRLCFDALSGRLDYMPSDEDTDACLKDFLDYYTSHIDIYTRPYPGIVNLLGKLASRGCILAVASNKFQSGAEKLVAEFFPGIDFVAVLGNSPDFPLKPDAAVVDFIRAKTGAEKCQTMFVGDSGTDILTARNGGVKSIAVSWGFRPVEDLAEADFVVDSPEKILTIIENA